MEEQVYLRGAEERKGLNKKRTRIRVARKIQPQTCRVKRDKFF